MKYNTDLTDKQWHLIEPVFRSNKRKIFVKYNKRDFVEHSKRDLVNAVLYLIKTGCQWKFYRMNFRLTPPFGRFIVWSFYQKVFVLTFCLF